MTSLNKYEIASMRTDLQGTQLSMSCKVERLSQSGVNPDGHPIGTWETLHDDLPCWYWEAFRRQLIEEVSGPNIDVMVSWPHMLIPHDTDITADDRIASVTGVDGAVIATNLNIRSMLRRMLDVELIVETDRV